MAQIGIFKYGPYFEDNMNEDGVSSDHPGDNTRSYIALSEIRSRIADLPVKQESGEVTRGNELGLLRLNQAFYPECEGGDNCGIALGVSQADHKIVRPILDEIFGTEEFQPGSRDLGSLTYAGNKWTRESLQQSAKEYIESKNTLEIKNDPACWTTMVLHKLALGIDLDAKQAQDFIDFQAKAVILTPLPSFVPEWFGGQLGVDETLKKKAKYIEDYKVALVKQVNDGVITTLDATDDVAVTKAAWGFLDALIFAGGLSVPGVIHGGLAAYYSGLTGMDWDPSDTTDLALLVMETIRMSPPVLGVPYIEVATGFRHAPLAGMGGFDKSVYGDDVEEFRIRNTLDEYHALSIDWADTAVPAAGAPWSNRICPAKSMSYNMIQAFWEALDMTNWYVDPDTAISRENGPLWWSAFTIHRSCEITEDGKILHVGAYEASRSHANTYAGDDCNWFSWCDDGFECNRKWWQWSGNCKVGGGLKFLNEDCSKNEQCDNVVADMAGVDMACRFGKCGFVDGNICDEDPTVEFPDTSELPPINDAGTATAWSAVVGTTGLSAAAIFMLRKPDRHLKHLKMSEGSINAKL